MCIDRHFFEYEKADELCGTLRRLIHYEALVFISKVHLKTISLTHLDTNENLVEMDRNSLNENALFFFVNKGPL